LRILRPKRRNSPRLRHHLRHARHRRKLSGGLCARRDKVSVGKVTRFHPIARDWPAQREYGRLLRCDRRVLWATVVGQNACGSLSLAPLATRPGSSGQPYWLLAIASLRVAGRPTLHVGPHRCSRRPAPPDAQARLAVRLFRSRTRQAIDIPTTDPMRWD
jgi:hypothetical protein